MAYETHRRMLHINISEAASQFVMDVVPRLPQAEQKLIEREQFIYLTERNMFTEWSARLDATRGWEYYPDIKTLYKEFFKIWIARSNQSPAVLMLRRILEQEKAAAH
ncbi:hypothetical protein BKA70DRAFT_1440626 [Coprinopsis sp. MPI-PUGE-AT-0042]|nr:hypothetical protein BKA70DRAFT_1440626 [Coprinopsis sp. MPI-PUGE-AT-0042]